MTSLTWTPLDRPGGSHRRLWELSGTVSWPFLPFLSSSDSHIAERPLHSKTLLNELCNEMKQPESI